MNIEHQDRIALGVALLLAIGSAAWFGGGALVKSDREPVAMTGETAGPSPARTQEIASPVEMRLWECPPRQSAGANWIYEVFTPPEIQRDAHHGTFSVRTPVAAAKGVAVVDAGAVEFGLELRSVARVPFRLQLIGYVGAADALRGVFEDQVTGRTLLARAGQQVGEVDCVVETMLVERRPFSSEHPGTVQPVATAVIRDVHSGERVSLNDQWPALTDGVVATVSLAGDRGASHVVRDGDEIDTGEVVFRIGKIQLAPPSLEVTKTSLRSPSPESRILLVPPMEFAGMAQPTL